MCDLFAMSANEPNTAAQSLTLFAEKYSKENPDGWGIASYDGSTPRIVKKIGLAKDCKEFWDEVKRIKSRIVIAHLRLAKCGGVCDTNCHPFEQNFMGRRWVFAHNGKVPIVRMGDETDSEAVFRFLIHKTNLHLRTKKGFSSTLYTGLKTGLQNIFSEIGKGITLNFIMSDGSMLYAFSHHSKKPMYMLAREGNGGPSFFVSTRRLTSEKWESMEPDRLFIVANGILLMESEVIL